MRRPPIASIPMRWAASFRTSISACSSPSFPVEPRTDTYNDVFTYHRRGAKAYVDGLAAHIPPGVIRTRAACTRIDLDRHEAYVGDERLAFDRMIISAPLPRILELIGEAAPPILTANKVLVFNLGFDRPSTRPDHWVYYPEPEWIFFRVGHYDNILGEPRMSLYVEVARPSDAVIDAAELHGRVLSDLARAGVITDHRLISHAHVVLDPAYVHVSSAANAFAAETCAAARGAGGIPARTVCPVDLLFDRGQHRHGSPAGSSMGGRQK